MEKRVPGWLRLHLLLDSLRIYTFILTVLRSVFIHIEKGSLSGRRCMSVDGWMALAVIFAVISTPSFI